MSAEIIGLPDIEWSAHAALAAAMSKVGDGTKLLVAWIDKDGSFTWNQAGMNRKDLYLVSGIIAQDAMHNSDGSRHNRADPDMAL